jgi:aminopeptidase N
VAGIGLATTVALLPSGPAFGAGVHHRRPDPPLTVGTGSARVGAGEDPAGVGDPYFPTLGNGGYDVRHYELDLDYDPATDVLAGTATIEARATQKLGVFHFDLRGLEVVSVTVNRRDATHSREGDELVIEPGQPIKRDKSFTTEIAYSGVPQGPLGWVATATGSYVLAEPDFAQTWFPANDHPSDQATFTFRITVPDPFVAVANGVEVDRRSSAGRTTYVWEAEDPMVTYLATVAVGDLVIEEGSGPRGIDIRNVFARDLADEARAATANTGEMIEFFSGEFGPYPFDVYGSLVVNGLPIPVALETQTMPTYGELSLRDPGFRQVVFPHELAHQWFGDAVSLERYQDMWLNEGFATYGEWLWLDHEGAIPLETSARNAYNVMSAAGGPPPGDPGPDGLFNMSVYLRGGLTLYALRSEVGERDFEKILRTYFKRFNGKTVTTPDFVKVTEQVSGEDLQALFDTWLYDPALPPFPE